MTAAWDPTEAARLIAETREDDARMTPGPWEIGTSNSFRRISASGGPDGGVLRGYVQRHDGHHDLAGSNRDADLASIARLRNNAKPLADQFEAAYKRICEVQSAVVELHFERDRLAAEVDSLTKSVDELESSVGQLIDQRDKREAQIDAIADARGDEGEWSNLHDRGAAAIDLTESVGADLTRLRALESRLLTLFETSDPDIISQTMEMVIRDRDEAATRANTAIEALGRIALAVVS